MNDTLIFKIATPEDWKAAERDGIYDGSARDKADGFLHFSTASQLPETLRLYYADTSAVVIAAVSTSALGSALKYEHSPSRNEDFPHLHGSLDLAAVQSTLYMPLHPASEGDYLPRWLASLQNG